MSEQPLPEVSVPTATSKFNDPAGDGFVRWFAQLRESINVLAVEILARSKADAVAMFASELIKTKLPRASNTSDFSWSLVDEDGRRTFLEAGRDGRPSPRSADLIAEVAGPKIVGSVGIRSMDTKITGLSVALVDEDGRRTWLEADPSGRPTPRSIAMLQDKLQIPVPVDATSIITPASLPVVVGRTYRLYYRDFIGALDSSHQVLTSSSGNGGNWGDHWRFSPTAAGSFNLTLTVVDKVGATVKSKVIPVTVYAAPSGAGKRHLAIGDSITRAGNYAGAAVAALPGSVTVGTRTYNNGALNVEGRGGWTLDGYMTRIGNALSDSPFLFPVGVAGAKFWGNTEFWRKVCHVPIADLPSAGYDFEGFQHMARGWRPAGNPYLYDVAGYPTAPAPGDVVVDPTKAAAERFQQYTGGVWTAISPQPAVEFSFPKYMERYAAAYPAGGPTSISLMLETNDFFQGIDDARFSTWRANLNTVIASIRAWSPTVPFIILLAATGGPSANWSTQTVNKFEFDQRMRNAAERILAEYDTQTQRDKRVYVTTFLGAISAANMSDHVHPTVPAGHEEMAPYLAGMLAKLTTEGI